MRHPYGAARSFAAAVSLLAILIVPLRAQAPEPSDVEQNGEWLYVRNCESCHGTEGDGQGPLSLAMNRPARSFADGGFAFGNTREAMFRVVSAGMPGSQMPGFLGTLSEAQRWKIVDYVRENMMPEQPSEELAASVMIVSDRPRFARGYLPPIAEGVPMRPRGLLVGLPEGLTFEYRIDDVRLLGVRWGGFCDRSDWGGRGGSPLRPLGQLIHTDGGGDPPATFEIEGGGALPAKLTSCWQQGGRPHLRYSLLSADRREQVRVVETQRPEGLTVGPGFTRELVLGTAPARRRLAMFLCDSTPESEWMLPLPEKSLSGEQWFVRKREDGYEHILVRPPTGATLIRGAGLRVGFELADRSETSLTVTYFKAGDWSAERLEALAREIGR